MCASPAGPGGIVEFGGPEELTALAVVRAFEETRGLPYRTRHIPRPLLAVGSRVLAGVRPDIASVMAMALHTDTRRGTWDATPLRHLGITARSTITYIDELARAAQR